MSMKGKVDEISSKFHMSVLQQNDPLNAVNDIHNQFGGNIVFICQHFCAYVLIK